MSTPLILNKAGQRDSGTKLHLNHDKPVTMETGDCNVSYVLLSHKVSVLHQADCRKHLL